MDNLFTDVDDRLFPISSHHQYQPRNKLINIAKIAVNNLFLLRDRCSCAGVQYV